ncbi:protein S40-7-like [Corylus avellana]|uniref:protein S40-7-like n=1 Tax=Corylus avellana TaxID=13451 RepID=UPI001E1FD7E5|nr:protein S40-7-like [Corylus avellana]
MENRYGLVRQSSGLWRCLRDGDFEEEDVWAVLRDRAEGNSTSSMADKSKESSVSVPRPFPSATRMIPRATTSSSSCSDSSSHEPKIVQQSAPVNIQNWSQISGQKSKMASKNSSWLDRDDDDDYDDGGHVGEDSDEDDNNYKLPPHEVVARRLARSQISSFSVFEGVGRTLKGRDLSKVRNAVLTKTGFLESP